MYFDSSTTAKINKKALQKTFSSLEVFYNSNSQHDLGRKSKALIKDCEKSFLNKLELHNHQIIFCSGASEANNMVILGLNKNSFRNTIILSPFEHPSVLGPVSYLQRKGFKVKFAPIGKDGKINEKEFLNMIDDEVCLISIAACESELGIKQSVNDLAIKVKEIDKEVFFHSDITQSIAKYKDDYSTLDFLTFSGHKFGSLKGIGALIKKEDLKIKPIMYGSDLKPGTVPVELIYNMSLALEDIHYNSKKIQDYNNHLRKYLSLQNNIFINSPINADPHILNISLIHRKSNEIVRTLNAQNIYLSSQSACSNSKESRTIYNLYKSHQRAQSSIRISLSEEHTMKQINLLLRTIRRLR